MSTNPFKPPAARLDPDLVASSLPVATWVARILGGLCVVASIGKMLWLAVSGMQSGLGVGASYFLGLIPIPSAVMGALVFVRSRYALAASILATALRLLLGPWMRHMARVWLHVPDDPFDYGQALFESLHPPSAWWLFDVAVIGFCMWDYRRRFAAWRTEPSARERPPVESA